MTFEREIYFILKNANKPMTTTEIVEAITAQYCGDEKKDYYNYISKMESWAAELKAQGTKYAKTWTEKEDLGFYKGERQKDNPCNYKTYTFRCWQAIK